MKQRIILGVSAAITAAILAGCSDKATEPYNDSPRTSTENTGAAQVITMPDGFSNVASKCDGPNRVYVVFHSDSAYGSVAVVPNDPRCTTTAPSSPH